MRLVSTRRDSATRAILPPPRKASVPRLSPPPPPPPPLPPAPAATLSVPLPHHRTAALKHPSSKGLAEGFGSGGVVVVVGGVVGTKKGGERHKGFTHVTQGEGLLKGLVLVNYCCNRQSLLWCQVTRGAPPPRTLNH